MPLITGNIVQSNQKHHFQDREILLNCPFNPSSLHTDAAAFKSARLFTKLINGLKFRFIVSQTFSFHSCRSSPPRLEKYSIRHYGPLLLMGINDGLHCFGRLANGVSV